MRLIYLAARNLYGHLTFADHIGDITTITGPNESGKTSRLAAIEIALHGKQRGGFPLVGSPDYDFSVEMRWDDGTMLVRSWTAANENHAVTFLRPGQAPLSSIRKVQSALAETLGKGALWRLDDLVGMSANKRQSFIESDVLTGAWTPEESHKAIRSAPKCDGMIEYLRGLDPEKEAWVGLALDGAGNDGRLLLTRLVDGVSGLRRAADARKKALTGAVKTLEKERAALALPEGTVPEMDARIALLDEEIGGLHERIGGAQAIVESRAELEKEIETVTSTIGDLEIAIANAKEADEKRPAVIADLDRRISTGEAAVEETTASITAEEAKVKGANDRRVELSAAAGRHSHAMDLQGDAGGLKSVTDAAQAVVAAWGASGHAVTDSMAAPIEALDVALHTTVLSAEYQPDDEATVTAREEEKEGLEITIDAAGRRLTRFRAALNGLNSQLVLARAARLTQVEEGEASADALAKLEATLVASTDRLEALRSDLSGMEDPQATIGASKALLDTLTEQRVEAVASRDKLSDHAVILGNIETHNAEMRTLEMERAKVAAFESGVRDALGACLSDYVLPLAEVVNVALGVIGAEIVFRFDGGLTWEVWRGNRPLGHGSGSVQALTALGMQAAIQNRLNRSGGWRFLGADEMLTMDEDRIEATAMAARVLIDKGLIDNFIGIAVRLDFPAEVCATHIELERA